jgi:hypothetical protein
MTKSMTLTVPAIGPSANRFYAGMHPMKRKRIADEWHSFVHACIKGAGLRSYDLGYPAETTCECRFPKGARRTDSDNLFLTAKLIIDTLVRAQILVNDSPKYVASVKLISGLSEDSREWTVLTIRPAGLAARE